MKPIYCSCCLVISHVLLHEAPWIAAHLAPLSLGLPRQEYWSGLPFPSPAYLPTGGSNPGIKPTSLLPLLNWQAGSLPLVPPGKPSDVLVPALCKSSSQPFSMRTLEKRSLFRYEEGAHGWVSLENVAP